MTKYVYVFLVFGVVSVNVYVAPGVTGGVTVTFPRLTGGFDDDIMAVVMFARHT